MTLPTLPACGVHHGVPESVYRAWDAINQSRLKDWPTPAHLRTRLEEPAEAPSDEMILGTAQHLAILDPGAFAARVRVAPVRDRRTKEYKAWEAEQADDAILLTPDQGEACAKMAEAVRACKPARLLLEAAGACEAAMLWKDADTGLVCKGRIDRLPANPRLPIIDLKTARSATTDGFARAVDQRGYDLQAAFYVDGLLAATGEERGWAWIVVENTAPYAVAVYDDPNGNWLAMGRLKYRDALQTIRACRATGEWPAYPERVSELPVPLFVARRHDLSMTSGNAEAFAA